MNHSILLTVEIQTRYFTSMFMVKIRAYFILTILFSTPNLWAKLPTPINQSVNESGTIVQLMEWPFDKIASECENYLAPFGYEAVQVSPVEEHVTGDQWWTRYQRVSDKIISRSGNENQLKAMILRCHKVGVKIYVDFLVNHMAGQKEGLGYGGTPFKKYSYNIFKPEHFHKECTIEDWEDEDQLRNCELAHLSDLKTELSFVQNQIAKQMNYLIDLGVDGFRVDAAKHVPVPDLEKIYQKLKKPVYLYHEIMEWFGDNSPIKGEEYHHLGSVYEVRYTTYLTDALRYKSKLHSLYNLNEKKGLRPHNKALIYIANHDTQRWDKYFLTYKEPKEYQLAHVFMLAWPYGTPRVMSNFYFEDHDEGPKGEVICGKNFVCEHRWKVISEMVKFRKKIKGEPVLNWWSNQNQLISFNRGSSSFVVINSEKKPIKRWFNTHLKAGVYENILNDQIVKVPKGGWVEITLNSLESLVLLPVISSSLN